MNAFWWTVAKIWSFEKLAYKTVPQCDVGVNVKVRTQKTGVTAIALLVLCTGELKIYRITFEPRHDKTNNVAVRPAKTQISLGICPVWSESSLSAWRKLGSLATHWVHSEDSDKTGRMPRLIWVYAGRTATLLVLSCRGSFVICHNSNSWSLWLFHTIWLAGESFTLQ